MSEAFIVAVMAALCSVESSGNPSAINPNDGGSPSYGLCQIKLGTARMMGFKGTTEELWHNPEINHYYAMKYFKWQLERYDGDLLKAIAAYNSGSIKYKRNGDFVNLNYVRKVMSRVQY